MPYPSHLNQTFSLSSGPGIRSPATICYRSKSFCHVEVKTFIASLAKRSERGYLCLCTVVQKSPAKPNNQDERKSYEGSSVEVLPATFVLEVEDTIRTNV